MSQLEVPKACVLSDDFYPDSAVLTIQRKDGTVLTFRLLRGAIEGIAVKAVEKLCVR